MRQLPILNFRDVSGYTNIHNETMIKNKIFRGAALDKLSSEDVTFLQDNLQIRYILDFRDEKEAAYEPDVAFNKALYQRIGALQSSEEQGFDFGNMLQGDTIKGKMTIEKLDFLLTYIRQGYCHMPFNNPAYHRLFALLLQNDGHVYFHCSAGKDRTGIGAFLIMLALDMSEEDAIAEYLLSNTYLKAYNDVLCSKLNITKEMEKFVEPLLYVTKENILLTIQAIKNKYDSYHQFLEQEYCIDDKKRKILRSIYCK